MTAPLSVALVPRTAPRPAPRPLRRVLNLLLLAVLLLGSSTTAWLVWDNRRLDVNVLPVVPVAAGTGEGDGASALRIAQVSDLHAASFGTFPDRVLSAVRTADPDLIALTGDLVDVRTLDPGGVLDLVGDLRSLAPVVMVLGNHEADSPIRSELLAGLRERGVIVLRDEVRRVPLEGGTRAVTVIGLDDPRVARTVGRESRDPAAVLAALPVPDEDPVVLLAHRPEALDAYAGHGIDLVLSGHAHGGQVRVPGLGGLFAPHQGWWPELTEGVHRRGDTTMVISRGLGNSVAGVRVNNPRELVVVDLAPRPVDPVPGGTGAGG